MSFHFARLIGVGKICIMLDNDDDDNYSFKKRRLQ